MDHDASPEESLMAADDAEFLGGVLKFMLVWTLVVIAIGIGLIFLIDPITSIVV